jgi:predicted Fe-Mo cluster-binding NifX family protein
MKIAISTDGDQVSAHFGRCPSFTLIDVEDDRVKSKEVISNPGHHPGFLPQFFHERGVEYIIAGGAGWRAQSLFAEKGIKLIVGISGTIEETIEKLLKGELRGGENICHPGGGKDYGIPKTEKEDE